MIKDKDKSKLVAIRRKITNDKPLTKNEMKMIGLLIDYSLTLDNVLRVSKKEFKQTTLPF